MRDSFIFTFTLGNEIFDCRDHFYFSILENRETEEKKERKKERKI